jgi:hypothetical protein
MSAASAVVQSLNSDEFSTELYDSVSLAAALAKIVTSRAQVFRMANSLRKTSRSVQKVLDLVNDVLTGKRKIEAELKDESPRRIQDAIDGLDHISRMLDYACEGMSRARLTNNSLTAGTIATLRKQNEELKDIVDWLDAFSKKEELKTIFDRARSERDSGDLIDLTQVN